jgi:Ca2+/Na+ antiporter
MEQTKSPHNQVTEKKEVVGVVVKALCGVAFLIALAILGSEVPIKEWSETRVLFGISIATAAVTVIIWQQFSEA